VIIARSPFRITLAGGGTDLPSFYRNHGSTFLSCAIDKHIYVGFRERHLDDEVRVQYLETESVNHVSQLKHNRARACLESFGITKGVEVNSTADLSARSGMGSSGSYLVGLIACLRRHAGMSLDPAEIAAEACRIEMDVLNEPVGKQDQYISSFGSITEFNIDKEGHVSVNKLHISDETKRLLEKNCMIFYTGVLRNASEILSSQQKSITKDDSLMLEIQQIGIDSIECIKKGDLDRYGSLMHKHWLQKRKFGSNMSVGSFDGLYETMVRSGKALGGKIIGAGGGGFMMLYIPTAHDKIEQEMNMLGFSRMRWNVAEQGVQLCMW
jgi:D-glycero-alpha-D-manno-heptose-7-phosphate kinase